MIKTLIVDDEPSIIKWFLNFVDWSYYNCEIIASTYCGKDAMDFLDKNKIDLIITDVCLPDIDGLSLLEYAKERNPAMMTIVISAHSDFEYVKKALKLGVENYLLKPIDPDEVSETLQGVMERGVTRTQENTNISVFKNNLLQRWVKNAVLESIFKEQAKIAEIDLTGNNYSVIVLKINIPENKKLGEKIIYDEIIKECSNFSSVSNFVLCDDKTVIGIIHRCFDKQDYCDFIHKMKDNINIGSDVKIKMCVGKTVRSYMDVNLSYKLALHFLPVSVMLSADVLFTEDYNDFLSVNGFMNKDIASLIKMLKNRDISGTIEIALNITKPDSSINKRKSVTLSVCAVLFENLKPIIISDQLNKIMFRYPSIQLNSNLNDWIVSFINTLFYCTDEYIKHFHPYVQNALNIIRTQYSNSNLNLSSAANSLNVSSPYLGQLFKTQTGKYFNEYLCSVRLDSAIDLISETNLRIGDIAIRCGFANQSYLNRMFRKEYRLSPVEYRKSILSEKIKDDRIN